MLTKIERKIYYHQIYIDLGFHKLWKDWFKVRKQLPEKERPHLKFYKGDCGHSIMCDYYMDLHASFNAFKNKKFALHVEPLGYKYKWGQYVYTYRPEIVCVFNKKIIFTIRLEEPNKDDKCREHEYWQEVVNLITQKTT